MFQGLRSPAKQASADFVTRVELDTLRATIVTNARTEGRLTERAGGGTLPEVSIWKTFGDITHDAVYRR